VPATVPRSCVVAERCVVGASPVLTLPPEPEELRRRLLKVGRDRPRDVRRRLSEGEWITDFLWGSCGPELERAGADRGLLAGAIRDYGLELWLWVVGERLWSQCVEGLAGRVSRRLAAEGATRPEARRSAGS